jgi:hypothetical protein
LAAREPRPLSEAIRNNAGNPTGHGPPNIGRSGNAMLFLSERNSIRLADGPEQRCDNRRPRAPASLRLDCRCCLASRAQAGESRQRAYRRERTVTCQQLQLLGWRSTGPSRLRYLLVGM